MTRVLSREEQDPQIGHWSLVGGAPNCKHLAYWSASIYMFLSFNMYFSNRNTRL